MSISHGQIPFVYFLLLDETLPTSFYALDARLKHLGYMLVPVRIDQLQVLLSSAEQTHSLVVCSVENARDFKLYNQRVRKFLKFLLKSRDLTFMLLTSFSRLSDVRHFGSQKNYFCVKYPLETEDLSRKLIRYLELKDSMENRRWPGGRRAGLPAMTN